MNGSTRSIILLIVLVVAMLGAYVLGMAINNPSDLQLPTL